MTKLICLNIGIKIDNANAVVNFLAEQDADIVCLQEVANPIENSVKNIFRSKEIIKKALGKTYPYRYFSPLWQSRGFTSLDFGGFIEQGNYILSKLPINKAETAFFHKEYKKVSDWKEMNFYTEDHGRALQTVELDCNGKKLCIMNIHGIWTADKIGDSRTIAEINFILNKCSDNDTPTIVAGDFNLLPETDSIKLIDNKMTNLISQNEIQTTRPEFKNSMEEGNNIVDYVFINNKIQSSKFEVPNIAISDHLPLILEFELN
jgi:endonuclease/exonuclease/phosphatase family metal-dependent hydrolase